MSMGAPRRPRRSQRDEYRLYTFELRVFDGTRKRLQPLLTYIEDLIELCENESKADFLEQLSPRQLPLSDITPRSKFSLDDLPPFPSLDEARFTLGDEG
jgi:hypothetical protein